MFKNTFFLQKFLCLHRQKERKKKKKRRTLTGSVQISLLFIFDCLCTQPLKPPLNNSSTRADLITSLNYFRKKKKTVNFHVWTVLLNRLFLSLFVCLFFSFPTIHHITSHHIIAITFASIYILGTFYFFSFFFFFAGCQNAVEEDDVTEAVFKVEFFFIEYKFIYSFFFPYFQMFYNRKIESKITGRWLTWRGSGGGEGGGGKKRVGKEKGEENRKRKSCSLKILLYTSNLSFFFLSFFFFFCGKLTV